jgi:hypothetical protein
VAGHHDRAGRAAQGLLQLVGQRRGQVVGRLVEQQQLRGIGDQQGQVEAAALPDRQLADRAVQVARGDQAQLAQRPDRRPFLPRRSV